MKPLYLSDTATVAMDTIRHHLGRSMTLVSFGPDHEELHDPNAVVIWGQGTMDVSGYDYWTYAAAYHEPLRQDLRELGVMVEIIHPESISLHWI